MSHRRTVGDLTQVGLLRHHVVNNHRCFPASNFRIELIYLAGTMSVCLSRMSVLHHPSCRGNDPVPPSTPSSTPPEACPLKNALLTLHRTIRFRSEAKELQAGILSSQDHHWIALGVSWLRNCGRLRAGLLVAGAPAGVRVRGGMDTDGVIRRIGPSQAAGLRSDTWTGALTPHHVR